MNSQATNAAGADNSGKVIFSKQPKSNNDPVIGLSLGTSASSNPLYNATVTFKAINFSHADSEGETVNLFGKEFTISTATDATNLVLFSSSSEVTLSKVGAENPTATVTVGGTDYTITLLNGDSTTATVTINGDSKTITEGNSKKVGGIDVAVKDVVASDVGGITATLLVGAEKVTITHGATVTKGSDDTPVDGTLAYITGTAGQRPGTATGIAIAVFRPDSNTDTILEGTSFVDPVWGSFKVDFAGISSPLADTTRDTIEVANSGDDSMSLTLTDNDGNAGTFVFAHNESTQWELRDDSNKTIYVWEHANASEDEWIVVGNEDYGHVLQVIDIFNSTGGDHTKHRLKYQDAFSGVTYEATFTSDTNGYIIIDGKQYDVNFSAVSGGTHRAQLKYPTSDSPTGDDYVVYPTIKTQRGALVAFYEPLAINLTSWPQDVTASPGANGDANRGTKVARLYFPDGDGYTPVSFAYYGFQGGAGNLWNVTVGSTEAPLNISTDAALSNAVSTTIGKLDYNFTAAATGLISATAGTVNVTHLFLTDPRASTFAKIDNPALIIFEGKDNNNNYEAIVIDLESDPPGTSTNGVGVNDVLIGTQYYTASATRSSDSNFEEEIDWWGTHFLSDSSDSDQKGVTVTYPSSQVYAQLYMGEVASVVTASGTTAGSTQLGDVLVKDTEVSSVSSKNLIIVGGTCINSAAANVLGGAYCGASFTTSTGVGSGQFLIQSLTSPYSATKVALVVAGYDVADTVNAARYLRTQVVDTTSGKKYKGTSATSAELVVE